MDEDLYESICFLSNKVSALIDGEEYEEAEVELRGLDAMFKKIDKDFLAALSEEEYAHLKSLAHWLNDSERSMEERRQKLISTITPLNSNNAKYQRTSSRENLKWMKSSER